MLCRKNKNPSWVCYGVIVGFILGFSYFALGVYNHSNEVKNNDTLKAKYNYSNNSGTTK